MLEPLAYHLTWTTHGTWLPGDPRGWIEEGKPGVRTGDPHRQRLARQHLTDEPVCLTDEQRQLVEATVQAHCGLRGWTLHAVNVRTNHVHVVVTADLPPDHVLIQFKAWCSRRLSDCVEAAPRAWWTKGGSTKWINDEAYLQNAIAYVLHGQ